jgi:hypothetical protein
MSAHGRSEALMPERVARRSVRVTLETGIDNKALLAKRTTRETR